MISSLPKSIVLYLAPLLLLTSLLLSTFTFLAPVVMLYNQVALLTVTPSQAEDAKTNAPSIFLGLLGSCSQVDSSAPSNCTNPTLSPTYDLTALPNNFASLLLSPPTVSTPAFVGIALGFSVSFFITFTLISFHHKMGKLGTLFQKPLLQNVSAWIGFIGFFIGLTAFLTVRMWFGKAVQDFNYTIAMQEQQGAQLVAAIGNGFTIVWVAFSFYAIPVILSLLKLNLHFK